MPARPLSAITLLGLAAACAGLPAAAQSPHAGHGSPAVATAAAAADAWADGEVRKVDAGAGTVTLRHGELKALNMPPMTMVFAVRDKGVLARLKTGDKVRFKPGSEGGTLTASEITTAK